MKLTQEVIDNVGELSPAIQLIDTNNIRMKIDGNWETISVEDVKDYGESYGERMQKLTDVNTLNSIWSEWNKVEKNEFKIEDTVRVKENLRRNFGDGKVYKVTKKKCYVHFERMGRIAMDFQNLIKVK